MKLLDLFCGAGGASEGYRRAGFTDIVGVDIEPQPNYPFTFVQADALEFMETNSDYWDLIHASPPCQVHSSLASQLPADHQHLDLIAETRAAIAGHPYVIENVVGAPLIAPVTLCGTSFDLTIPARESGLWTWELRRHRLFESSFMLWAPPECRHRYSSLGVYGDLAKNARPNNPNRRAPFNDDGSPANDWKAGVDEAERLMGIDWMTRRELVQAIPPAYTEWIGKEFLRAKQS